MRFGPGKLRRIGVAAIALAAILAAPIVPARKDTPQHWVGTWSASMQGPFNSAGRTVPAERFENQTVRMIVHTTIGGHRARVWLSNTFGTASLAIGAAHIAIHGNGSAIVPGSDRPLTFSGRASITIPPGAEMLSDNVALDVPESGDLAVSVYVPNKTDVATWHSNGLHTTYISGPGDFTAKAEIPDATKQSSWYWLAGVDVVASSAAAAIVAFGDSITDGSKSTIDADRSWPSDLARRLLAQPGQHDLAVLNAGIGGNRILHDQTGSNALARFGRDVLSQAGVEDVIVLEGINDIRYSNNPAQADQAVSAEDIIAGYRQLIERAHARGIRIFGGTMTPCEGEKYCLPDAEAKREAINNWTRTSGAFDGVIDFEAATRDPDHPTRFLAAFDSGDHLHPNDAGYKAMADAVNLSLFSEGTHKKSWAMGSGHGGANGGN